MSGLNFGVGVDNKLKTFSLDEFKDNYDNGNHYDWSGRISNVKNSKYQFNSNAQKNWIKYINSDKTKYESKDYISVLDETIQFERDLYKIDYELQNVSENGIAEHILYKQRVTADGTNRTFENTYSEKPNIAGLYIDNGANAIRLMPILPNDNTFGYNPYIDGENENGTIVDYLVYIDTISENTASLTFLYSNENYFFAEPGVKVKTIGDDTYTDLYIVSRVDDIITFNKNIFTEPYNQSVLIELYHDVVGIVSQFYSTYKKLIERPIVKECSVLLDFYESANIDFRKPIYTKELGKYCLLLELTAPNKGLCEAKLLLINQTL